MTHPYTPMSWTTNASWLLKGCVKLFSIVNPEKQALVNFFSVSRNDKVKEAFSACLVKEFVR